MAKKAYLLSDDDLATLQELVEWRRNYVAPATARIITPIPESPSVYIARVPAAGIAALQVAGTGSGTISFTDYTQPGSAECQLYEIVIDDVRSEILPLEGETETVYNLSPVAIDGDSWILAVQDRFGAWIAVAPVSGGGGGASGEIVLWGHYTVTNDEIGTASGASNAEILTIQAQENIPVALRLDSGLYILIFGVDFLNSKEFVWSYSTNGTGLMEISRTSSSLVVQTVSLEDVEQFNIDIHGRIGEAPAPDPNDPSNPVDPVTPLVETSCCPEGIPNSLCFQIGAFDYSGQTVEIDPEWLLLEGEQGVLNYFSHYLWSLGTGRSFFNNGTSLAIGIQCIESNFESWYTFGTSTSLYTFGSPILDSLTCDPFEILLTAEILNPGTYPGISTGVTFPIRITTAPCLTPPTGTYSDDDITIDATTITIYGTGFDAGTPSNNVVTFNLGATGTVTAATSTSLTVTFDTNPTSTGALTAIVVNGNGTSAPAVQVATVVTGTIWSNSIVYDEGNIWYSPDGVTTAFVECWGAGDGLGGGAANAGGGGGAYAATTISVTPLTPYTVAAPTTGPAYFDDGSQVFAAGAVGQAGGQAINSVGDVVYSGGDGGNGGASFGDGCGGGGGAASAGGDGTNGTAGAAGPDGAGGTGGAAGDANGGAGSNGRTGEVSNQALDGIDGGIPGGGAGGSVSGYGGSQGTPGHCRVKISW